MLTPFVNTELDRRQLDPRATLGYRVLLFSRWQDTDNDIVNGSFRQAPIDLTPFVLSATLNLSAERDASTLNVEVSLQGIPPDVFYNCIVQVQEGVLEVDPADWPITFTGWHVGQPQASEANTQDLREASTSVGARGSERRASMSFSSRAIVYNRQKITTPGLWLPRGDTGNPDPTYAYREAYDDIGSIAREIATAEWGMGLNGGEVLFGQLPYRIQKQLQVVDESVLEALRQILQPLRLNPYFNGEGKLTLWEARVGKETVRSYTRGQITSMPQSQANQNPTNAVIARGLDSETSEVIYADQRLVRASGTFGYFDSDITFRGTWGDDEDTTFRIKVGQTVDGNGATIQSGRIVNFETDGFIIQPVNSPTFVSLTEYEYEIEVTNDVFLVIAAITALFGGYAGLTVIAAVLPDVPLGAGGDVPNPGAIIANILAAGLLIAGLLVLQQIGNFSFEVWGVPYEVIYKELQAEAVLRHFATFDVLDSSRQREYEKRSLEVENHIFSSLDSPSIDGQPNIGLIEWSEQALAWEVAKQARRSLNLPRDILLEPGDAILFDEQVIFVDTISRRLERGATSDQQINGWQIRRETS